jgi:hypothetical protein
MKDNDNDRINTQTFDVTTSWNKVSLTFVPDTTGPLDDDNAGSFQFGIWLHAGSDFTDGTFASNTWAARTNGNRVYSSATSFFDSTSRTFFITGVQLEVGETATPFEHRSFGDELARCLRYYEEWGGEDAYQPFGYFEAASSDLGYLVLHFSEKRDGPTVTVSNASHFHTTRSAIVPTSFSFSQPATTHVFCTIAKVGGFASGQIYSWRANNSTAARIYFNAEL